MYRAAGALYIAAVSDDGVREFRISAEGHEAVIHEAGVGSPPVVLLASMFVRARSYEPLLVELSKSFRTIVVEAPGSGLASRVDRPWNFERYGQWLAALLETMELQDITLIGHSNSGPPVFFAGARHAERIGR